MRSIAGVLVLLVVGTSCATRTPSPPPPQPWAYGPPPQGCLDGPPMCGADRRAVVQCQRGAWVTLQPCPGPRGCTIANNAIQCDSVSAQGGEACAPEGGYGCTPDRRAMTQCRGGRSVVVSTCRGARGCAAGNAVDCDNSLAAAGDPCDGPNDVACSTDNKVLLRCTGGRYQPSEPCRNACLATSGRVLCQ